MKIGASVVLILTDRGGGRHEDNRGEFAGTAYDTFFERQGVDDA